MWERWPGHSSGMSDMGVGNALSPPAAAGRPVLSGWHLGKRAMAQSYLWGTDVNRKDLVPGCSEICVPCGHMLGLSWASYCCNRGGLICDLGHVSTPGRPAISGWDLGTESCGTWLSPRCRWKSEAAIVLKLHQSGLLS